MTVLLSNGNFIFYLYSLYIYSILNSVVIVMFLSGMVAMIMLRTLHKDIARYNQLDNSVREAKYF